MLIDWNAFYSCLMFTDRFSREVKTIASVRRTVRFVSERTTLRSLYAISRPSVVCLSVMLVHPTQAVELFGNFFFTIR